MGNTHIKPHPRQRNKKQVHWKAAARPHAPGKPFLVAEAEQTPDLVTIRWIKPPSDGGSPISGYLVEHRRTGSPHWVRATPLLVQLNELTISGLEPGWRYQFRISAENAVGISDPSELSEPITVTLQRSAVTAPRITQELQDTSALENEKAEFVVHFLGQPPPKVCWYKDAFEIFSSRRIRILTENDRSVLTIHQCSLSDEGEIKCTATNRAGHVSTKCKLVVEAPPTVRLPRQYEDGLLFEMGELIRLKVSVAGHPTPLVFWSHNGESIKNDDNYEIEYVDNSSILKITEAKREDRGEYLVKAVNKLGEHTQSFLVTVTNKPSPPGRARVVMALGRSVTLSWNIPNDDGGCKIGNYIIEYYRLGWDVWLKAATSRQLTTMLGDLIEGSEYKFRVKAESPYGISEPSEESEVIFIPDTKRGIVEPPPRSKSQPRDIPEPPVTPAARRKNKPRSASSTRVEEDQKMIPTTVSSAPPVRPMRTKVKSPTKTPEASPLPHRRDLNTVANKKELEAKLNKEIFSRADSTVTRDMAYGSPDIKLKKEVPASNYLTSASSNMSSSSGGRSSRSPSPSTEKISDHKVYKVKIEKPPRNDKNLSPSPQQLRKSRLSRDNSENLTGSSEFMLVLYPDENQKGQSDLDFEDSIPPPMSLSAPELGIEAPMFTPIKTSASSTELLHERAMNRLYEAAKAEEQELERRRKSIEMRGLNIEIPKIQINSKDRHDKSGKDKLELERVNSIKRRLSGGTAQHLWTRRHSLKSYDDVKGDTIIESLEKSNLSPEEKREMMMKRQRSDSEEIEEQMFEEIRSKMSVEKQDSKEKRKINIAEVEKWADDYVSSTEDSSFEEDDDEINKSDQKFSFNETDEEEETYHPRELKSMSFTKEEPFEILTKRKEPPSPNFKPKPILKKKELEETLLSSPIGSPTLKRALSPIPPALKPKDRHAALAGKSHTLPLLQKTIPEEVTTSPRIRSISLTENDENKSAQRKRSFSLLPQDELLPVSEEKPNNARKRSFSLLPQAELLPIEEDKPTVARKRSFSLIPPDEPSTTIAPESIYNLNPPKMSFLMQTISAAATISGITAASIVIPDRLVEKQKDAEEAKVVVDHYSDIVRNYGSRRKSNASLRSSSSFNKSQDSLQKSNDSLPRKSLESLAEASTTPTVKTTYRSNEKSNPIPVSNYHDPYLSYRSPQSNLNKQGNALSSVSSSAESGYLSSQSQSPLAANKGNNATADKTLREGSAPKPVSVDHKSNLPIIEKQSNTVSPTPGKPISRPFSPTSKEQVDRPFSPTRQPGRPLSPTPEKEISPPFSSRPFSSTTDEKVDRPFSPTMQTNRRASKPENNRPFSPNFEKQPPRPFSPTTNKQEDAPYSDLSSSREPPDRKVSASPARKQEKRKAASPYPKNRRTSPSPMGYNDPYTSETPSKRKTSPSPMRSRKTDPSPMRIRPPMLKEIMTQTSEGLGSMDENYPEFLRNQKLEELHAQAEVKVHYFVDYLTDLAMFSVACWFYLFSNELFAIPVLLVLAYRQLQVQFKQFQDKCIQFQDRCRQIPNRLASKVPRWMLRLMRRTKSD
ncbi:titin-like isoform X2 [Diabrotica virgifera virgifera]|uniref:Muscle M-line assembly protein unc-89-like n=1 Tax=Diabrotica virgifera virgifera TaxID=50390 RepID=A0ABM5L8C1_DIAVI|nr:titin-like isoform X2 [Diabrotica virgifera virgifera]